MLRKRKTVVAAALGALVVFGLGTGVFLAQADTPSSKTGITVEQATAVMRAAVAAQPGLIEELEVKRKGKQILCEVSILDGSGRDYDVLVDIKTHKVISIKR